MPEIFNIAPEYGVSTSYEFKNDVHETMMGLDYINVRWRYPVAKINFQVAVFAQSIEQYIRDFFLFVEGGEDVFLFQDPMNDSCQLPSQIQSDLGIEIKGILVDRGDGTFQLCKEWRMGVYYYRKPIAYPKEITIYQGDYTTIVNGVINYETGQVTGVNDTMVWTGTFYTPVRFENDSVPFEIMGYNEATGEQWYQIPDLRLIEVKQYPYSPPLNIANDYDHYFQLSLPINTQIEVKGKTDIFTSDSGYEARDALDIYKRSLQFSYTKVNYYEQQYLLGLWLLTLGGWSRLKLAEVDAQIDTQVIFKDTISFSLLSLPQSTAHVIMGLGDQLYKADNINLLQSDELLRSPLCQVWIITRKDNIKKGFTNHDSNLFVEGLDCLSQFGLSGTSSQRTAELSTDSSELMGIFAQITEEDLITGKYDDALVEIYIFNWLTNGIHSKQFTGNIGGYTIGYLPSKAKQYQIEVQSITEKLNVSVSAATSSECRHRFLSQGYGRCNLTPTPTNTTDAGLPQIKATVGGHNSLKDIIVASPATDNWIGFLYGTLKFLTGVLADTEVYIADVFALNGVVLLYELPVAPSIGDEVLLTRPCNKTIAACNGYNNMANYGGFPRLPGMDNLVSGAEE